MRRNGFLLPISSLPSKYGIGSFSKEAYERYFDLWGEDDSYEYDKTIDNYRYIKKRITR